MISPPRSAKDFHKVLGENAHVKEQMGIKTKKELSPKKLYRAFRAAEGYLCLVDPRPEIITNTTWNNSKLTLSDTPVPTLTEGLQDELLSVLHEQKPAWFDALKPWEQSYLTAYLKKNQNHLKKLWPTLFSAFRSIPGLANFCEHALNVDDKPIARPVYRIGLVVPIDIKNAPERQRLANLAMQQFCDAVVTQERAEAFREQWGLEENEKIPVLYQTLISPNQYKQTHFLAEKDFAVSCVLGDHFALHGTNRPSNAFRLLPWLPFWGSPDRGKEDSDRTIDSIVRNFVTKVLHKDSGVNAEALMTKAQDGEEHMLHHYFKKSAEGKRDVRLKAGVDEERYLDLEEMLMAYAEHCRVRKMPENIFHASRNRNLHLAALERCILDRMGGVFVGSCVSGKDRMGLTLDYGDAMLIDRHEQRQKANNNEPTYWMPFEAQTDTDQNGKYAGFRKLFGVLTGEAQHSSAVCEANTYGCRGLKMNAMFHMPKLLVEEGHGQENYDRQRALAAFNRPKFEVSS